MAGSAGVTVDYLRSEVDKKRLIDRLARVEGQLRGVQKMITEERECERVAQQLAAARGALNRAFYDLIACAFERKLTAGGEIPSEVSSQIEQIKKLLTKYA
jgi:DNA-binding FrmR family transcriptional regulator